MNSSCYNHLFFQVQKRRFKWLQIFIREKSQYMKYSKMIFRWAFSRDLVATKQISFSPTVNQEGNDIEWQPCNIVTVALFFFLQLKPSAFTQAYAYLHKRWRWKNREVVQGLNSEVKVLSTNKYKTWGSEWNVVCANQPAATGCTCKTSFRASLT